MKSKVWGYFRDSEGCIWKLAGTPVHKITENVVIVSMMCTKELNNGYEVPAVTHFTLTKIENPF